MSKRREPCRTKAARRGAVRFAFVGLVLATLAGVALTSWQPPQAAKRVPSAAIAVPTTLSQLLGVTPDQCRGLDIAQANLLCAQGLNGAQNLDVDRCLATLDEWAKHVAVETARTFHQFKANPQEFRNSEGYFRMLLLVSVLQQDCGVRYNPARMSSPEQAEPDSVFFADAQDLFLHGILGPRRMGTCVSMPVLYVTVGRRLGYPLKLVTAKGHLFARWEGAERFNIEGTNSGMNSYEDAYYQTWPIPLSAAEVKSGHYLKSLTADEELGLFLSTRGQCLFHTGRLGEAQEAFAKAAQLAPDWPEHAWMLARSTPQATRDPSVFASTGYLSQEARAMFDAQAEYAEAINQQNRELMAVAERPRRMPIQNPQPYQPDQPR